MMIKVFRKIFAPKTKYKKGDIVRYEGDGKNYVIREVEWDRKISEFICSITPYKEPTALFVYVRARSVQYVYINPLTSRKITRVKL